MTDNYGLNKAKEVANKSTFQNSYGKFVGVGAIIVRGNRIVSSSVNKNKTHPLMKYYNKEVPYKRIPYLHAEVAALLAARWEIGKNDLMNCTIYIARKLNCDGWGLARPCPACMQALKDAGIKKIVYTTENGYAVEYINRNV